MKSPARDPSLNRPRLRRIARRVSDWFHAQGRDLPWRRDRDGYTAIVSELMLQQTQASRVAERYGAFLARFPTVQDLAAASEQDVLAMWQGLGYYRRARHLHAAARAIMTEHNGVVPGDAAALRTLPGVGRYTAGAVASIVFGQREPIVDGNVARVLARLFGRSESPDTNGAQDWLWAASRALVEAADDPSALNEGMMELGATVCTPAAPRCAGCPLKRFCAACREGLQEVIPPPQRAAKQKTVHHHVVVVRRRGLLLLEQRSDRGLWAKMWQAPTVECDTPLSIDAVRRAMTVRVQHLTPRGSFAHQTTHRRITFHVFDATSRQRRGVWRRPDDLAGIPLSNPQRRILAESCGRGRGVQRLNTCGR